MRRTLRTRRCLAAPAIAALTGILVGGPAGCRGGSSAGDVRFYNEAPVWRVNDRVPFMRPPVERKYYRNFYHTDGYLVRRTTRALDVPVARRAADVNSLDEVPDSTWFTNRIGVRELTLDEARRGPTEDSTPLEFLPWRLTGAKRGGTSLGFTFEDTRGVQYLLKFDLARFPEMETGAHIIGNRILWACGYNVAEDYLGYIRREDLWIKPGAIHRDAAGNERLLVPKDIEDTLEKMFRTPDGHYRVLASRILPGKPLGPFTREGVRKDDPNDVFPHERRRTLRGQYPMFAWLNHTDIQEDQSLDMFEPAPGGRGGYVVHYILDFGLALGVMGYELNMQTVGYTYRLDGGYALQSLLTLGLWRRPWEDVEPPGIPGIGMYESLHYEPGEWRPNSQYWPFEDKDRFDAYWGSKILIRFTPAQLAAIVGEARYSHPEAAPYMVQTLIERQRETARYWFGRVTPLDNFLVEPSAAPALSSARRGPPPVRLCFDDLAIAYNLDAVPTLYHVEAFDAAGVPLGFRQEVLAVGARSCVTGIVPSDSPGNYTIVKLTAHRDGFALPPVRVHLARQLDGGGGPMRVIGLRRE